MHPITTSFEVVQRFPPSGKCLNLKYRSVSRQAKPYNLALGYGVVHRVIRDTNGMDADSIWQPYQGFAVSVGDLYGMDSHPLSVTNLMLQCRDNALNLATQRFNKAKGESSALLVGAVEVRQSAQMIQGRATQLFRGFRALKSLRFYDAAKAFNLVRDKKPKSRRVGKHRKLRWVKHPIAGKYYPRPISPSLTRATAQSFSALCLEYNFGWAPLVGDIQTSVRAIEQDIAYETPLVGSAKGSMSRDDYPYQPGYLNFCNESLKVRCRVGATWSVTNPNYELSRRLGLVDLATAAIELVPFSFVLNWFVNLNEWVGQLSNRYDPNLKNVWYSVKFDSTAVKQTRPDWDPSGIPVTTKSDCTSYTRYTGSLPDVSLRVRQQWFTSFTRAANASSLLVSLFSKKERPTFLRL